METEGGQVSRSDPDSGVTGAQVAEITPWNGRDDDFCIFSVRAGPLLVTFHLGAHAWQHAAFKQPRERRSAKRRIRSPGRRTAAWGSWGAGAWGRWSRRSTWG